MVALVQSMNLPLFLQPAADTTQILQRAEQAVQQYQWRAIAGNAVVEFNTHGQSLL